VSGDTDALNLSLPKPVGRGRVSPERRARYEAEVKDWCRRLLEIKPRIDFDPGARGWCYIMEEYGLSKGDFDNAEKLITKCRKNGRLPLDFCGDDDVARDASHEENLDVDDPEIHAEQILDYVARAHLSYDPVSFWDFQDSYVQMLVEKIALKNLFDPVCGKYHVPLRNGRGSSSIWQRVRILERFAQYQAKGKRCVLLTGGDHDAHGLRISRVIRANLEDLLIVFREHFPEYRDFDLDAVEIERFGLNADFIERHGLSWTEGLITGSGKDLGDPSHRKNGDHDIQSYIKRFGQRKVEADALVTRPAAGRALCDSAILKFIDQDGVDEYEQERLKRQGEMRIALDRMLHAAR
jgi:hypothetical protein